MSTSSPIRIFALIGLLCAGGYGLYQLGIDHGQRSNQRDDVVPTGSANTSEAADGDQPLYWHDPMYPQYKFDKPGKSPFMDMQLVPVYAKAGAVAGSIEISNQFAQNLGIRTARVTRGAVAPTLELVGNVAYNERDVALVQARSSGFVEAVYVRAPFDPVRKGQALAALYVPQWVAAQEEFLAALRIVRRPGGARLSALLDGARRRMRQVGMDDTQIARVESSGQVHALLSVTAPRSGILTAIDAREGMTALSGAPLFSINSLDTVWLNVAVPEARSGGLAPGANVEARSAAYPSQTFSGTVGALLPEVDPITRTVTVRIELANPQQRLQPGMFVTVTVAPVKADEALRVPTEAVIETGTRAIVVVVDGAGTYTPVAVATGAESGGQTEILAGLAEGQVVVVSGQFLIDSEASLQAALTRLGAVPEQAVDSAVAVPRNRDDTGEHSPREESVHSAPSPSAVREAHMHGVAR